MKKPDWSPRQDLDAKATQATREAQKLPPGPERIEAMNEGGRTPPPRLIPTNRQIAEILGVRDVMRKVVAAFSL